MRVNQSNIVNSGQAAGGALTRGTSTIRAERRDELRAVGFAVEVAGLPEAR
jgi:hypothetical protein